MTQTAKRGFTLIELLVVVSIIALLVSILLPALSKAREQARRVMCATQQRAIAVSHLLYAHDNNDDFFFVVGGSVVSNFPEYWPRDPTLRTQPSGSEDVWYRNYADRKEPLLTGGYLEQKEQFYCPNYFKKFSPTYSLEANWWVFRISYAMFVNSYWTGNANILPSPDFSAEKRRRDRMTNVKSSEAMLQDIYAVSENGNTTAAHDGGASVAFTDGRVEWVDYFKLSLVHYTPVHWYPNVRGYWLMHPDAM